MIEKINIGKTSCHYVSVSDFKNYCEQALQGNKLRHIVTLNPEMVVTAGNNNSFTEALYKADLRVPDGAGIIWARWFLRSDFWALLPSLMAFPFVKVERVTGIEAVTSLSSLANKLGLAIYLLGGTDKQNSGAKSYLKKKFPDLEIFSGLDDMQEDIASKKPAIVFVAYGSPKQTIWIEKNRTQLEGANTKIAIGIGGAFAILAEDTPRAPTVFRKLNIEWLWRLILQPNRLGRIINATVKFPILINKQKRQDKVGPAPSKP